ncbi:MAG: hypothetical protein JWM68_4102 [Verrucomicrobiales bacterium]|nr:hypothetical protein [Verrucomicrobiales bacterium]
MISPELLKILRCPETHQPLSLLNSDQLAELNQRIAQGKLQSRNGNVVSEKIDGGLVREDGKVVYPLRGKLPILLIDEAIPLVPR